MVKINTLELENVKRIKAVQLTPAANGLTIVGNGGEVFDDVPQQYIDAYMR